MMKVIAIIFSGALLGILLNLSRIDIALPAIYALLTGLLMVSMIPLFIWLKRNHCLYSYFKKSLRNSYCYFANFTRCFIDYIQFRTLHKK